MDPKATLEAAQRKLIEGNAIDAAGHLFAYYNWRVRSGFQPYLGFGVMGDDLAERLAPQIMDALESNVR